MQIEVLRSRYDIIWSQRGAPIAVVSDEEPRPMRIIVSREWRISTWYPMAEARGHADEKHETLKLMSRLQDSQFPKEANRAEEPDRRTDQAH